MNRSRGVRCSLVLAVTVVALVVAGCSGPAGQSSLGALAESAQSDAVAPAPGQVPGSDTATVLDSMAVTSPTSATSPPPPPPPPAAVISPTPADGTTGVDPLAPISVAVGGGTLSSVRVTNPGGEEVPGTLAPDGLSWTAAVELGYGTTYTVAADARNVAGAVSQSQTTFTTVVPGNLTAASSFPSDGMTVGIGQPISVFFDEPVADHAAAQQAITVTTAPAQAGGFRWISDLEVRWRPASYWQPGTTVAVAVKTYGKNLGNGTYGQADMSFGFAVGRSMVAEIDDNTHTMVVTQDGQVINTIPVSMGRDQYPTYNGVHVVAEKYETKIMDSRTWGLTGAGSYRTEVAWATRISDSGEFVHAAPWSVDSQGYENVSHGCVNVSTDAAKWFYDTFIPGDLVIIGNTVGPPLEVWDGYGDFQMAFEQYVA